MVGLCCFSCGNGWIGGLLIGLLWWVLVTVVGLDWVADCCGGSGLLIGLWIWWIVDRPVVMGHIMGCSGGGLWVWWVGLWRLGWVLIGVVL